VESVERLVELDNQVPELTLVPLDASPEEAREMLGRAGLEAHVVGKGTSCLRMAAGTDPVEALAVLPSVVQDPAANLVVRYADPEPGTKVADLCAAPGGKALALSGRVSYTVAADRSDVRMKMVRDNAQRTGRHPGMVVADAARAPFRELDAVLLDVPCTGTGTLRRHPDGRWRLSPSSVAELAAVQGRILEGAAPLVRPGGLLVYSTCTLEPEENEGRIETFLAEHPEFSMEPTDAVPDAYLDAGGFLRVLPHETDFDGAFAARMRRAA
jgi:16S rRNA (cytosine967-C5)-methyltransferase